MISRLQPWIRICLILSVIGILAAPARCPAQEQGRQFLAAMEAYKSGDYAAAVKGLEAIADAGVRNGQLYYNLGNAYLKNNDLGRALLWYERALTLIPHDPDLRFNYEYARSLTKDLQEGGPSPLTRILFFWAYELSARTIIVLALACNLIFWGLAIAWRLTRRRGLRHALLAVLALTLVFVLTAAYNYFEAAHHTHAVVLPPAVAVRSGLEPTSTELFQLHAGARVKVVRQMQDHVQIQFSENKIGWIPAAAVGRI
jgi:tetratricopeptide (TPR) repeat protein